jgi:hypothetical protein
MMKTDWGFYVEFRSRMVHLGEESIQSFNFIKGRKACFAFHLGTGVLGYFRIQLFLIENKTSNVIFI